MIPGHTELERWYRYASRHPRMKVGMSATRSRCAAAKIAELNSMPVTHPYLARNPWNRKPLKNISSTSGAKTAPTIKNQNGESSSANSSVIISPCVSTPRAQRIPLEAPKPQVFPVDAPPGENQDNGQQVGKLEQDDGRTLRKIRLGRSQHNDEDNNV